MPLRNLVWLLVVPGLVGLGLVVAFNAPAPDQEYELVRRIVEVLAEVDANYVRELSPEERQELVKRMINGGLRWLDPHSAYFDEEQLKEFERDNEGSFSGVGILLGLDEPTKALKIVYPLPGTPAYEAGLMAGDRILKIDDTETTGMTPEEAKKRILGETGTKVSLTLRREGRTPPEFTVTLVRSRIPLHPVAGVSRRSDDPTRWNWFLDPQRQIAYVRVTTFNELATREVQAAVREIEQAGGRGLILDLRDNPGGLLSEAVALADLFLTEGRIVTTRDRRDRGRSQSARAAGTIFLPAETHPIAVLVNRETASASEIVAAALQDHQRAVVVGERTFGKGSVQSIFRLPPDQKHAVKLTTQTWWRPSGRNIDKATAPRDRPDEWGVTPDAGLEVVVTEAEYLRRLHEVRKLEFVPGKPEVVGPNPPPPPPIPVPRGEDGKPLWDDTRPFQDRQLDRALEYLRGKLSGVGKGPAPDRNRPPAHVAS